MIKKILVFACISGASAVVIGAFGAHILKKILLESDLQTFETGVRYHFYHTLALMATAILGRYMSKKLVSIAGWLFIIGIAMFSGSLYFLAIADAFEVSSLKTILGPVTPLGGLLLIGAWLTLLIAAVNYKGTSRSRSAHRSSRSSASSHSA